MAVKRGKSQARRNSGNSGGLPGWAWMVLGVVLTVIVVMVAPRLLQSEGEDGFYRPRANPDALPAPASDPDASDGPATAAADPADPAAPPPAQSGPEYDFYTLLPGQEVPMTDAELAASARAEQARERQLAQQREQDAAQLADEPGAQAELPAPTAEQPAPAPDPAAQTASAAPADTSARYLLQAGAFSASGDAEALKARIALLGLTARVESAQIQDRTVYRVRMGPYGTASELAEAKRKLGAGGLDTMAIRVQ